MILRRADEADPAKNSGILTAISATCGKTADQTAITEAGFVDRCGAGPDAVGRHRAETVLRFQDYAFVPACTRRMVGRISKRHDRV